MSGTRTPRPPSARRSQSVPRRNNSSANSNAPERAHQNSQYSNSITRGVSIEDYDPSNPKRITERATLMAMQNLCILKSELKMPTESELRSYAEGDEDIKNIILQHHQQRISKLINQIKRERQRLIDSDNSQANQIKNNTVDYSGPKMSAVEMEQVKIEKLRKRHQREVEQMVATLVALDAMQKDSEMREKLDAERRQKIEDERRRQREEAHQKHLQRLQEMEMEEQRKLREEAEIRRKQFEREQAALKRQQEEAERKLREAREAEKQRQERAEQNRQHLMQIEEDRQNRILAQQRKVEEREVRRLQTLREENERRQREHEEMTMKRQMQIQAAKQHERDLLEKKRRDADERDQLREKQFKEFENRRLEEQRKYAEMQKEKVRRNSEARIRLAEEAIRKRNEKVTTDAQIAERLKKREESHEKRAENARTGRGDLQIAAARRNERWKEQERKRYNDMKKHENDKEKYVQQILLQKEQERRKIQIQRRLKEEEKVENAHRLDRQRQKRLDHLKERMDNTMQRVENIQAEKYQLHRERQEMLSKLEREREEMSISMRESFVLNKTDPKSIQRMADMYNIDIAALQEKAKKRTVMGRKSDSNSIFITSDNSSTCIPKAHSRQASTPSSARRYPSRGGTRSSQTGF